MWKKKIYFVFQSTFNQYDNKHFFTTFKLTFYEKYCG